MAGLLSGRRGIYIKLSFAIITLVIAIFDLFSDWFVFGNFLKYNGGKLTTAIGVICAISSLLFLLELRNGIVAVRLYRISQDNNAGIEATAEKKLERWQETVSFLLMIFEDIPVIVILYITFRSGNCPLYLHIFEESITANLSLLASFISALWKLLLSFRYCCNCCNYHDLKGIIQQCCCCCARMLRPIFAIILIGLSAFLYFTFQNHGQMFRSDCFGDFTTEAVTLMP